ncbi:hypothetical protein J6590_104413 [Homalodisca vitripennis]|nr:hypothetical protein J6590_104413 [Homalodisca vitripennis]
MSEYLNVAYGISKLNERVQLSRETNRKDNSSKSKVGSNRCGGDNIWAKFRE